MDFQKFFLQEAEPRFSTINALNIPSVKFSTMIVDLWNTYIENSMNLESTLEEFGIDRLLGYSSYKDEEDMSKGKKDRGRLEGVRTKEWSLFVKNFTSFMEKEIGNEKLINIENGTAGVAFSSEWLKAMKENDVESLTKNPKPKTNFLTKDTDHRIAIYDPTNGTRFAQMSADDTLATFYAIFDDFIEDKKNFKMIADRLKSNMKNVRTKKYTIEKLKRLSKKEIKRIEDDGGSVPNTWTPGSDEHMMLDDVIDAQKLWGSVAKDFDKLFNDNEEFEAHYFLELLSGYKKFGHDNIGSANYTMVSNPFSRRGTKKNPDGTRTITKELGHSRMGENNLEMARRLADEMTVKIAWKTAGARKSGKGYANTTIKIEPSSDPDKSEDTFFGQEGFSPNDYLQNILNEYTEKTTKVINEGVFDIKAWIKGLLVKLYEGLLELIKKSFKHFLGLLNIEPVVIIKELPSEQDMWKALR